MINNLRKFKGKNQKIELFQQMTTVCRQKCQEADVVRDFFQKFNQNMKVFNGYTSTSTSTSTQLG